jgi:membrane protease subunit HflC
MTMNRDKNQFTNSDPAPQIGPKLVRRSLLVLLFAGAIFLLTTSVVLVDETEYVLIERLGNIVAVYDRPSDRGLHFKLPWPVDAMRRFDRRVQLFDPPGREIFTRDKKNITIDAYVCWKIAEPDAENAGIADRPVVRFFRGLGSADVAEARLDSRVRSILTTNIGQVELSKLLFVEDSESGPASRAGGLLEQISREVRSQVVKRPGEADSLTERLGIDVVDVRVKRINLPVGNQQAVFERMRSERQKNADRYRRAGMAENKVIKSRADRQYNEILAKARADAERIRGEAEAESIGILNQAHAQDFEFYQVLRTLDTYRKILNERTTLVLSASSNLLKLLSEGIPDAAAPASEPKPTDPAEPTTPAERVSEKRAYTDGPPATAGGAK